MHVIVTVTAQHSVSLCMKLMHSGQLVVAGYNDPGVMTTM